MDRHIPVKQLSRKELKLKSKPWITPALRKSLQVKNNLYKKFSKSKSIYYHSKFKVYRNKLNHLLRISKMQYYNQYFYDNISDGKKYRMESNKLYILSLLQAYLLSKL